MVGPQAAAAWDVIVDQAAAVGAPLIAEGQDWQVWEEHGRLAFQDTGGLLDLPRPNLIGAHQVVNAGAALAALRALGVDEAACEAAVTRAIWPARLQRLRRGPLVELAGPGAEVWLDGGHNPAAGLALAEALTRLPARPLHLVVGMLRTKDIAGFLRPLAHGAASLQGVSIPGEAATLTAAETVACGTGARRRRRPRRRSGRGGRADRGGGAGVPHPDLRLALPRRPRAARQRVTLARAARCDLDRASDIDQIPL